jgi:hypothetical protein
MGLEGPHQLLTAEWFAHMPYPTPSDHSHYYDFVATQHANKDRDGNSLAPCLLYSTQLRQCFHSLFNDQPNRPIVGLLNYCRSGGGLEFMRSMATKRHLGVGQWPLFLMSSSDAHVDSLVGGFWVAWFGSFCRGIHPKSLPPPSTTSTSSSSSSSSSFSLSTLSRREYLEEEEEEEHNPYLHHSHDKLSLKHIYHDAANRYFDENIYALMNEIKERSFSHQVWSLSFSWPGVKDGNRDPWHLDLRSHLVADENGMHGEPNFQILNSLQLAYESGIAFRRVKKVDALRCGIDITKGVANFGEEEEEGGGTDDVIIWTGRNHSYDHGDLRWSEYVNMDKKLLAYGLEPTKPFKCELTAWKGENTGSKVNLVEVVKESLKVIARPGVVYGEQSNVDEVSVLDFIKIG